MEPDWTQANSWKQLATRIPPALHQELKRRAVEDETSMMRLVVEAIVLRLSRRRGVSL